MVHSKSNKESKDQESIQSSSTPVPGYQIPKNVSGQSYNVKIRTFGTSLVQRRTDTNTQLKLRELQYSKFSFGGYIVVYTLVKLFFRQYISVAIKRGFRLYIRQYTSQNQHFEYAYTPSTAPLHLFTFKIFVSSQIGALLAPHSHMAFNEI